MSQKVEDYGVAEGHIQFDPKRGRQVNGQTVTDIAIKGSLRDPYTNKQALVSITLWPEFDGLAASLKKGDWLSVDGKITVDFGQDDQGQPRAYLSVSPYAIVALSATVKQPRQTVQAPVAVQPVAVQAAPVAVQPVQAVATQPVAAPAAAPVPQAIPQGSPF